MTTTLLIICAIVFPVCLFALLVQPKTPEKSTVHARPRFRMLNREGVPHEDEWYTYIAGVGHHVSASNVGGFTGWVANDADNKHDHNAMGVYNETGKLLGYIAAKELDDYRDWCEAQPEPCVGIIYIEDGQLRGRVKVIKPCNEEFLSLRFGKYLQWVKDTYGSAYLPKKLSMDMDIER